MNNKFSPVVKQIINQSGQEAHRLGHDYVGTEHLLLGIVAERDSLPVRVLDALLVDMHDLKRRLERAIPRESAYPPAENLFVGKFSVTTQMQHVLQMTFDEAKAMRNNEVFPEHLMLSLLKHPDTFATKLLKEYDVDYESFKKELGYLRPEGEYEDEEARSGQKTQQKNRTPVLNNFSRDLTKLAEEGKLDAIIGREREIAAITHILSLRKKNTPILIGERGVGKTAIVEALACCILSKKISQPFFNKRVVALDLASLILSTKPTNLFEERLQTIVNELEKNRHVILLLEEIHTIIGTGNTITSPEASRILRTALESGKLTCIGTSTPEAYRQFIEKDDVLERHFQKVRVEPPTEEDSVYILRNIKAKYEEFHAVTYTDEAIETCIRLSNRYITERFLPNKAIDILDEVGARVHLKNIIVPHHIEDLEKSIEELKEQKNLAVKNQQYEEAANLRDAESKLVRNLEYAKIEWEDEIKLKRYPVIEDDVYEIFSLKTDLSREALRNAEKRVEAEVPEPEILTEINYFKDKVEEYELENKASIKIGGIPNHLKTSLQQYILFFKDYLEKVKGKSIYFEVSKIEEGLRVDIRPEEIDDFEQLNMWFTEYLGYISKKTEDITVNFEKKVEKREAEVIMAEVKNQVKFLENQIELIQTQVKSLKGDERVLNRLSLTISDQQKYLIEQGYSDLETFKFSLKQMLSQGKGRIVLDEILKYFSKLPENQQLFTDEIFLFNSRLSDLEFKIRGGVLPYEIETLEKQKINHAIIDLINKF